MRIPIIRGLIDRRVLVNYRIDPEILARACPAPFRPQVVNGFGVAGICLIRLKHIRPRLLPAFVGIASENAAHRIAVEWEKDGVTHSGVYIPRRDTSSLLNALVGGRVFPGVHHRATFRTQETDASYRIEMESLDGSAHVSVDGRTTDQWPDDSVFSTLQDCSQFFQEGSLGYSPRNSETDFDGLELRTNDWSVQALETSDVRSSFFEQEDVFPKGSVTFDNALLMQGIDHTWHSRESLCA